eukprot:TRINITY_DN12081_c0_g2_i1.p1 TRINITY_DN12081_c0_g2~~TRINITY_DN12081_c0_g2_i1.p1  ORF type:complete len:375 (-),score=80.44 TRINITY_DN12081_c0_g2_i1:175-1299(-)
MMPSLFRIRSLLLFLFCTSSSSSLSSYPSVEGRDVTLWPFASWSIWNLPIGKDAKYVPGHIKQARSTGMTTDPDILILDATSSSSPLTPIYYNSDGWTGKSRCSIEGKVLFSAPLPSSYIIPGAQGSNTPNYAGAILDRDGVTVHQTQPMAHCTASGPYTSWIVFPNVSITQDGIRGAHGGSGLSSIGGTLRLGELVPNGSPIRHVLKVNLFAHDNYYRNPCFRWPAVQCDDYHEAQYNGTNPSLMPGSLLALPTNINITHNDLGLETQPAKMLAWTLQNYGAYPVDDTAWSAYAIETEQSPRGTVDDEFQKVWRFPINEPNKNTPWGRDMDRIFMALSVIDNWNEAVYNTVKTSNGAQGAGGGAPLQPWAPAV